MIMNQKLLEPKERELISKILDFRFELGNTIVCLKDVFAKVTLNIDTNPPVYKDNYEIGLLKVLRNCDLKYFSKEMGVELGKSNYPDGHPLFERQTYFRSLDNSIENIIENGGIVTTSPLGEFIEKEKRVNIYLDNVNKAASASVKDEYATRESILITTFIHELFHVWIYSTCGEKRYTVREIEEAMVEFVTLYFLKKISQVNKEFEPIFRWAERSIRQKQAVFGRLAANGYGYYLYSLLPNNEQQVLDLFIAYSKNSGLIKPSPFVKHIIIMLDSLYPFEREEEVFECLQKLLLDDKVV